ncbi:TPA: hypothetical protein MAJ45_005125 [Klebsiella pneumoniae]|uniref:hypothetical protein n=1 Tax=Klebsiella variicola TaxID=244366 RepID=UPI001BA71F21|nr:hypothetical protein [Klebsiella variicola]HBS5146852.1 hypothetical protein [Klebsiella pneumoniae]MBQ5183020.1 hypothetical protein [Klebsiella variicola]HCM5449172.1 hypothetical protein [Klebsiella pneumoniae]HCM5520377.1 hypothetical protein [Klebsiella pneumoniae]HCM6925450.1 hypothetical protein [Klebsiella pneumoniae]
MSEPSGNKIVSFFKKHDMALHYIIPVLLIIISQIMRVVVSEEFLNNHKLIQFISIDMPLMAGVMFLMFLAIIAIWHFSLYLLSAMIKSKRFYIQIIPIISFVSFLLAATIATNEINQVKPEDILTSPYFYTLFFIYTVGLWVSSCFLCVSSVIADEIKGMNIKSKFVLRLKKSGKGEDIILALLLIMLTTICVSLWLALNIEDLIYYRYTYIAFPFILILASVVMLLFEICSGLFSDDKVENLKRMKNKKLNKRQKRLLKREKERT